MEKWTDVTVNDLFHFGLKAIGASLVLALITVGPFLAVMFLISQVKN